MVLHIQFVKFIAIGLANFWLTFAIFYISLNILNVHYTISLGISWFVGIVFSYILNYLLVFKPEDILKFGGRFLKFTTSYLASFFVNLLLIALFVEKYAYDPFIVQCGLIPLIVLFNYLSTKFWSLRGGRAL